VWITDSGTGSVHIFDVSTGAYLEIHRAGDALLQQPSGIATDAAGRIYLADSGTGGIYVFGEDGEFDRSLFRRGERPLDRPSAIALSADGRTIYVLDPPRNSVVALNREGEINSVFELPEEHSEPRAISVIDNQLYILTDKHHKVYELNAGGRLMGEFRWDDVAVPTAFIFDHRKRRFVVANPRSNTVQVFNDAGQNLSAFGQYGDRADQMKHVDSLYVDRVGLVYLVDSHEGKVLVFAESR
jgi:DNA-binding beta-propeller fold protein YncE